jgi:hypothetical protein
MRRRMLVVIAGVAAGTTFGMGVAGAAERDWRNDVPPPLQGFADAIAPVVSPETRAATSDTTCDHGYPYSGSNSYFRRPLATFRHSEPLGALFGYHRADPC